MLYKYACKLHRVVDGDTLDINLDLGFHVWKRERIRLYGIDTPEIFGPNATEEGKAAKAFVEQWFADRARQEGILVYESLRYDVKDKYGRGLGTITFYELGGTAYNLVGDLIAAGLIK